jgi:hypothetical protein
MYTIPTKATERNRDERDERDHGRNHVRFILVNGRSPRGRFSCVMCDQTVGASYLREIGTLLVYCDHNCYATHCKSAVQLLENRAPRSRPNIASFLGRVTALPSIRSACVQEGITDQIR